MIDIRRSYMWKAWQRWLQCEPTTLCLYYHWQNTSLDNLRNQVEAWFVLEREWRTWLRRRGNTWNIINFIPKKCPYWSRSQTECKPNDAGEVKIMGSTKEAVGHWAANRGDRFQEMKIGIIFHWARGPEEGDGCIGGNVWMRSENANFGDLHWHSHHVDGVPIDGQPDRDFPLIPREWKSARLWWYQKSSYSPMDSLLMLIQCALLRKLVHVFFIADLDR